MRAGELSDGCPRPFTRDLRRRVASESDDIGLSEDVGVGVVGCGGKGRTAPEPFAVGVVVGASDAPTDGLWRTDLVGDDGYPDGSRASEAYDPYLPFLIRASAGIEGGR